MPVIYELRGKTTTFGGLGINLYSGCAVGCRYCSALGPPHDLGAMDQRCAAAKESSGRTRMRGETNRGRSREILLGPAADPYQSDEATRLTRKALLILEQYRLRVLMFTVCGLRSVRDFDIFARNHWKYATQILFRSESLREEWEPGAAPIAERVQTLREAHAAGISTWVKIRPMAFPAELIGVVESLRADVDAWKIGRPLPGGAPPKPIARATTGLRRRRHRPGLSAPHGREGLER